MKKAGCPVAAAKPAGKNGKAAGMVSGVECSGDGKSEFIGFRTTSADQVAGASDGVAPEEQAMIDKIRAALGGTLLAKDQAKWAEVDNWAEELAAAHPWPVVRSTACTWS